MPFLGAELSRMNDHGHRHESGTHQRSNDYPWARSLSNFGGLFTGLGGTINPPLQSSTRSTTPARDSERWLRGVFNRDHSTHNHPREGLSSASTRIRSGGNQGSSRLGPLAPSSSRDARSAERRRRSSTRRRGYIPSSPRRAQLPANSKNSGTSSNPPTTIIRKTDQGFNQI